MLRSVVGWSHGYIAEIKTMRCSDCSLDFAAERCPNLEVLSIKSCPNVPDGSVCRIAFRCSKLREFDISYYYDLSDESLTIIGRNFPNLKVLKRNLMNWDDRARDLGISANEYLMSLLSYGNLDANAIAKFMPNLECLEFWYSLLSSSGLAAICKGCTKLE